MGIRIAVSTVCASVRPLTSTGEKYRMNLPPHRDTLRVFRKAAARALCIIVLALLGLNSSPAQAQTSAWSLTKIERQAYLNYYAPVILKRGDENNGKQGRDWLTNFDFDRD
jgi:hypothetical protein